MPLDNPINTNFRSPNLAFAQLKSKHYWKAELDIKDFVRIYERKGIVYRVLKKENLLMFKNGFRLNNTTAENLIQEYNIDDIVKAARLHASVGGYCLIYINYGDVQTEQDYSREAPNTSNIKSFFVISRSWIAEDIYEHNQTEKDIYTIYKHDGSLLYIHKSRFLRVKLNDDELSRIEPAWDSIEVLDNVLWGMGQTMFRTATGFPVLKIQGGRNPIPDGAGGDTSELAKIENSGLMKDFNTQVGLAIDKEDELEFVGAQGKAVAPGEYYDRAFQQVSVDLDVPVDILKGVAAGAITGSETNLREYYSDLRSKQVFELEPIFNNLLELFGIDTQTLEYEWTPIWEMSQQEKISKLKEDLVTLKIGIDNGMILREQAYMYLSEEHPYLDYDQYQYSQFVEAEQANYERKVAENRNQFQNQGDSSVPLPDSDHLDLSFVRKQYDKSDKEIADSLKHADAEESALPKKVQSIEAQFRAEMKRAFSNSSKAISSVLVAQNTDENGNRE